MPQPGPFAEPVETAKAAALRYVTDAGPGIRRRRAGRGFSYSGPDGAAIRDPQVLDRIRSLAIPPAWRDVWICPSPEGHLQATGRDARGRKQYRYHERWRAIRDETKYERVVLFGATLPRIRSRIRKDLARPGLPREKVLATIVRLLETSFIRVGNEEYARANNSFGLTTLRNRHVEINGATLRFRFQGKSGKAHTVDVNDRRLARLVERCRELPGQDLFQYLDDAGEPQPIDSGAVNDYLRTIAEQEFTAKDFRTWAGTLLAARLLAEPAASELPAENGRSGLVAMTATVARQLGNTPAITRKCYIHPAVLAAHQNPAILTVWQDVRSKTRPRRGLAKEEADVLAFLRACARRSLADVLKASLAKRPPTRGKENGGASHQRATRRSAGRTPGRPRAKASTGRRTSAARRYTTTASSGGSRNREPARAARETPLRTSG